MALATLIRALVGRPYRVPDEWLDTYPELAEAAWRVGGVAPRIGGWFLLRPSVAAITLGNVVFLASRGAPSAELLLHELAHVRQFAGSTAFPFQYVWESLRRGYTKNRYEVDARRFAAGRVHRSSSP